MKKVLSILFLLLFSIGLMACNGDFTLPTNTQGTDVTTESTIEDSTQGTDVTTESTTEDSTQDTQIETTTGDQSQIDYPKNLALTDNVLTWDAVDDAVGYYVYADEIEVAHVTSNTYTFTVTTEIMIVFKVVAEAPVGMSSSVPSAPITYVNSYYDEVASMKLAVYGSMMPFGDEFATELVDRGMLTTEFSAMNLAITEFMQSMGNSNNPSGMFTSLGTMLGSMDNLEPLIGALVIHVLPTALDDQVASLLADIEDYQDMLELYPDDYYYQEMIVEAQNEITMIQDIEAQISLSEEDVIMSIMIVIDYLIEFQSLISNNLITYLINFSQIESSADLNVAELVLIKEEIVYILTESMPTQADMTLLTQTMFTFVSLMAENQGLDMGELATPEKVATSMLIGFELGISFLDTLDQTYIQAVKDIVTSTESENFISARMAILFLNITDTFFDKQEVEALRTQLGSVYTELEKETMFDDAIATLEAMMLEQEVTLDISMLTYEKVMDLLIIFDDATDEILDALVASQGEILLIAAERSDWEEAFYENPIWNDLEYQFYNQYYTLMMLDQLVYILNSVASQRTMVEFEEVRDLVFDSLIVMSPFMYGEAPEYMDDLFVAFETFLTSTSQDQYELIQNLLAYLDEEDSFLNYATNYDTAFGDDMEAIYDLGGHFAFVEIISIYYGFTQDETINNTNINDLLTALNIMFNTSVFVDNSLAPFDVADIIAAKVYVDSIGAEVSAFDSTALSETQITRINTIMDEINLIVQDQPTTE